MPYREKLDTYEKVVDKPYQYIYTYLYKSIRHFRISFIMWGCNGLDGDRWYADSEPRRLTSLKLATSLNIKANEDYALAA